MTKGKPFKLMIFFAIPLLVSSILQQLYNICDTIMVGQMIGIKALAAIGASFPIFFSTIVINIGFTQGLTVITAQSFGAKDFTKMRRSVATSSFLATAFSLLCNLLLYLSLDNILHITKVPPEIIGMSKSYLTIITSFGVIISTYNLLAGFLRAIGDSKTPLYFLIFSSICNIGLNYVFIKYAKLGIRGSAYGTILAIFVTLILCLIYIVKRYPMLKPRANEWKINYNFCKEHLYIALPMALQFSIIVLSLSIVQTACNSLGYEAIAGLTAAIRIEQLTGNFLSSLGVAVTTFVAQNYGANMMGRVKKGVIQASQISFITSVILSLITFAFSKNLIMLFLKQEDSSIVSNVLDLSSTYLNLVILFYFFLGQIFLGVLVRVWAIVLLPYYLAF